MNDIPIASHVRAEIQEIARQSAPLEVCGVLVGDKLFHAKNVASNPELEFEIDAETLIKADRYGEISCYWHSHANGNAKFSSTDVRQCKAHGVPWYLFSLPLGIEQYLNPQERLPYLGREFQYGYTDCYALMRDVLAGEYQVNLPDFDRGEEFDWLSPGWNKFQESFAQQGFVKLLEGDRLQAGDCFLMQISAPNPNHVGILIKPEKNIFYQHLVDRLSEASIYGGYWNHVTVAVWRHQQLIKS